MEPVLISKVPTDLQLLVRRKVPESEWKLTTLLTTIEKEIIARERLSQSKPPRKSESKSPSTATTLVTKDSPFGTTPCCYCNQQHCPTECIVVVRVDERKQLLRKAGRCFSCL